MTIKASRYFRLIEHPLGCDLYSKISMEFKTEQARDKFLNSDITWEEGIVAEEITEQEYLLETEEE
ncbi:MAG: hypothetical protein ACRCX2_10260 [Paraclostridium sp.]